MKMSLSSMINPIAFLMILSLLFVQCAGDPEESESMMGMDDASEAEVKPNILAGMNQTLTVHTGRSNILWNGKKITGKYHMGSLKASGGHLTVADGEIIDGTVTLDMNSINVLNEEGSSKEKLERHLMSADFFETSTWPTATFSNITARPSSMDERGTHIISGELTMKGITHPVSFPANMRFRGNSIQAKSLQFAIDRSKWDVRYGSRSFFANLSADDIIDDNIQLVINLYAEQ